MANTWSSKQYGWKDLSVAVGGRIFEGITENEYEWEVDDDFLYGRGSTPHDIVDGNRSGKGKLVLWQSEFEAMVRDAPGNDVTKIRAEIINTYAPEDGGQIVTDICGNVKFGGFKKSFKQGDKNMLIELPYKFTTYKPQQ